MNALTLLNITYQYPTATAPTIHGVSIEVKPGTVHAVLGINGAGKTTLCNIARGFAPSFYKGWLTGEVLINGTPLQELNPAELSHSVGYIFQNPFTQISGVRETVFDEIAFGLENLGTPRQEIKTRVEEVLYLLDIADLSEKNPNNISGGQKQRVAIASIVAMDPTVLVIDEPTSQLDPHGTEQVFAILANLKQLGKSILLVEHKIEFIAEIADDVTVLHEGRVAMSGPAQQVLRSPDLVATGVWPPAYVELGRLMEKQGTPFRELPSTLSSATAEVRYYLERALP